MIKKIFKSNKPAIDQHQVAHLRLLGFTPASIAKKCQVPVRTIYDLLRDEYYGAVEDKVADELSRQLQGRQLRLAFQMLSSIERLLNSRDGAYRCAGINFAMQALENFHPEDSRPRRSLTQEQARLSTRELMESLKNGHRELGE